MRVRFMVLAAALAAELAMVTLPAQAGVFDDEEARTRIEQLKREANARLEKLEAAQRGQIELANQIETLRQEIAKLRGQEEVLTHDLDQLQKRQKDFYVDLDTRLRKLEQSTVEPKPDKAAEAPKSDLQAETRDYEAALNLFKAGKYKDAAPAFENFIKAYPNSQFQANAHYWLGNALYQQKDYRRATDLFHKVSTTWPNDPKAPDAMLGMANVQQDTGDAKNARLTLEAIVAKYPSSAAAELARDRLKRLKK